jgi:lipopolysaccharide/colanic/teichoic acid biosynthesis glycosyltransferase
MIFEKLPLGGISKAWLLHRGLNIRSVSALVVKRFCDIVASVVGLILLSPLFALVALAIKLTSPGNVLFIQPREGRFCRPFYMYKFRTMRQEESREDASDGFTTANDRRVTRIGELIRPLHLDELPQLINILKGDMSLVGPRPEALRFARAMAREIDLYEIRYLVRPGLTGHAQLYKGYMMDTVEDTRRKLEYDLFYLCNYSIFMDLRVIVRTGFVVLMRLVKGT